MEVEPDVISEGSRGTITDVFDLFPPADPNRKPQTDKLLPLFEDTSMSIDLDKSFQLQVLKDEMNKGVNGLAGYPFH